LKSIGFSGINGKKEVDRILKDVILHYDEKTVIEDRKNHMFAEISKTFGCDFGITVCGEYDENNEFQMEYYFPYFRGTGITTQEDVVIEKHAGKESYAGACDDVRSDHYILSAECRGISNREKPWKLFQRLLCHNPCGPG